MDYRRALLDTIAKTESPGYNVVYGGSRFSDFADHPRRAVPITSGPNRGKTSSAAGRYQFLGSTWDAYRDKLDLPDFSPGSQDEAAWSLASDVYKRKTGRELESALASGDDDAIAGVGKALSGTWTSLPGGIEQGQGGKRFVSAFKRGLGSETDDGSQAQNIAAAFPSGRAARAFSSLVDEPPHNDRSWRESLLESFGSEDKQPQKIPGSRYPEWLLIKRPAAAHPLQIHFSAR